jgi:hypothetical protein
VTFLSSRRAAAQLPEGAPAVVVGDLVRYTRSAPARVGPAAPSNPKPAATRRGAIAGRMHGRVGLRYAWLRQAPDAGYAQPGLDLRVATPPRGGGIDLVADVRTRRTTATLPDGRRVLTAQTATYQLAGGWGAPTGPVRLRFGRQYVPDVASLGLIDGLVVEVNRVGWSAGGFAASEPDASLALSPGTVVGGLLVRLPGAPQADRWSVTLGAAGSYTDAHANREFAFAQARYVSPRLTVAVSQEVDYYRPWKTALGERPFSLTSTYATATLRVGRRVTVNAGYDNRRNARLYRDVTTPAAAFDDAYRLGAWGGVSFAARGVHLGADVRTTLGGPGGRAIAYTASGGVTRTVLLPLALSARSTRYESPLGAGWLHDASVGFDPLAPLHMELSGGVRRERDPMDARARRNVAWYGADLDVGISHSWYLLASGYRETAAGERVAGLFVTLAYRF